MTPTELDSFLDRLASVQSRASVMIWGPPGIGKSQIVGSVARRHGLDLIDLRLSQLAPTDLRGLPVADHDSRTARWYPPEFLPRDGSGVLFLDELNMAPPALQGIAQQLILDRRVGSYQVPEGWLIWAAGNRREDRASVFDMPAPLGNRFLHLQVDPHFESFRSWATRAGIDESIIAFLAFRPALLHEIDAQNPAWPSPRSWVLANSLLDAGLPIHGAVGIAAAGEFDGWRKVYAKLPDLDAVIDGQGDAIGFPEEPSSRYAIAIGLGARVQDAAQLGHAFRWIADRSAPEWIQLFVHTALDRLSGRGIEGQLAALIAADPRMRRFLKGFRQLAAKAA